MSPLVGGSWAAAGSAFVLALLSTPAVSAAAPLLGLVDTPNDRSSHQRPVPRGGGIAIVAAVLAGLALAGGLAADGSATLMAGAVALAIVGLADDRFSLRALTRAAAQVAVALGVVLALGGLERLPLPAPFDWPLGPLGVPLAVLWIVAVVNYFNFLDGIDGIAAAQAAVTGTGICLAGWEAGAALLAAALTAAALGFLPWNWSPAGVFMGDVGSYFLGFMLAGLPLLAPASARPAALFFVALSLWLFLADAIWTMVRRMSRGSRVDEAHREHLYQQLARRFGHARVTLAIAAGSTLSTAAALAAWKLGTPSWGWAALGLAVTLFAAEAAAARRWGLA
jgi:Fuc2NAc and GlcNAc transferase